MPPLTGSGGGVIAFVSDRGGNPGIYAMNADGGSLQRLTSSRQDDYFPTWSPDGTQIAFYTHLTHEKWVIQVMDADGGNVRRLTDNQACDGAPYWSPDGTRIAFTTSFDCDPDKRELMVIDVESGDQRRLTDNDADDYLSAWSPDSRQIAFVSDRDGNEEIYVMDADGAEPGSGHARRLTDAPGTDSMPSWSPDGTRIAFVSDREGNDDIYAMDASGGNVRRLTSDPGMDWFPFWSPDGSQIVFSSDRAGNLDVYVMAIEGEAGMGSVRRLTDDRGNDFCAVWRPAAAARTGTWVRTFEGPDYGAFFDVVLTEDGNILAVGATNHLHVPPYSGDALLMELTLEGEVLWERTWGGDGYEQAWSVVLDGDGGATIFGETDSYGAGDRDFFLLKIRDDGTESWSRTYGGAHREWPYGLLRLSNGDLLIYGFTEPTVGSDRDQYALRVGPDGEVIWSYTVPGPGEELVLDALETSEGDLVLAVIVEEDASLVCLDAGGGLRWTRRYELPGWQYASQIATTGDGGFFLAGFSMSSGSRRQADTWLARCTQFGDLAWEISAGDPAHDDYATSLIPLDDGAYLIGGIGNGMLLSRVDQDGNLLWKRSLVGQAVYGASGLIALDDGGFLVAGFVQITNGRSYDAILLRTDAEGQVK